MTWYELIIILSITQCPRGVTQFTVCIFSLQGNQHCIRLLPTCKCVKVYYISGTLFHEHLREYNSCSISQASVIKKAQCIYCV